MLVLFIAIPANSDPATLPHIHSGCSIYDSVGTLLAKVPGLRCLFFADGSYLSGDQDELVYFDATNIAKWNRPLTTHHLLTLTKAGHVLVGSSSRLKIRNSWFRTDVLHLVDLKTGKSIHQFDFGSIKSWIEKGEEKRMDASYDYSPRSKSLSEVTQEVSHMNSYYEIPELDPGVEKSPGLRAGSIIVNFIGASRLFILDQKLSHVVGRIDLGPLRSKHDVQVERAGTLLIYGNVASENPPITRGLRYDLRKKRQVAQWPAAEPTFFAPVAGSIQILPDGHVFMSDLSAGPRALEFDQRGTLVKEISLGPKFDASQTPNGLQEAKRLDLSAFLKNHRAL